MGYHVKKIKRGEIGESSKIREEFEEFTDACDQHNPVMALLELSDLIGAIELYSLNKYGISLDDLIKMAKATQSAFTDGTRKSDNPCGEISITKWKCLRCQEIVNMKAFRCGCTQSPAPWEPIYER